MQDIGIDLDTFDKEKEIELFKNLKPTGWNIVIRLFIAPERTKSGLFTPGTAEKDKYSKCWGLVVGMSEHAYTDKERYTTPWCQLGDWVIFPRHGDYRQDYKGRTIFIIKEDAVDVIINDPKEMLTNE